MIKPILSICIPTYNRASCLKDCLDSIVSQFTDPSLYNEIEIVISDNASTDNTTEIVEEFKSKFQNIKYFRNEGNIGYDRNLLNVVERSSGKYCLTIGDDDAFMDNSLSLILKKIKSLQFDYYMLNGWGYDHKLINPVASHPYRQIKDDVIYESLTKFVKSIKKYIDIVGNFGSMSHIFDRESWINFTKKEQYVGTQTVHLFIILTLFKDSRFAILAEPVIKTRNDNMRWDSFPGLETNIKRANLTVKALLWINDLYNLSLSPFKIRIYFLCRVYWINIKELVKKILFILGLRS